MVELSYRRTFAQFVDSYVFTYYSAGVHVFRRLMGGPFLIFAGIVTLGYTRKIEGLFWASVLWALGVALTVYGLYYFLRPLLHIGLVWLRREEFLGEEGAVISLRLDTEKEVLYMGDQEGEVAFPLTEIRSIQHRADSAWILTQQDQMILVPRENLLSGDSDAFIGAIVEILERNEQKF